MFVNKALRLQRTQEDLKNLLKFLREKYPEVLAEYQAVQYAMLKKEFKKEKKLMQAEMKKQVEGKENAKSKE